MAYLYFTVTAVLLYLLSDWILNKIEQRIGKRLEYRSVVFFVIITVLSFNFVGDGLRDAADPYKR